MPEETCPHRLYRAYDDGDRRWDILCLECGHWPEEDELDPCAVSDADLEEGEDWRTRYEERRKDAG